jgi:hypothetical protein
LGGSEAEGWRKYWGRYPEVSAIDVVDPDRSEEKRESYISAKNYLTHLDVLGSRDGQKAYAWKSGSANQEETGSGQYGSGSKKTYRHMAQAWWHFRGDSVLSGTVQDAVTNRRLVGAVLLFIGSSYMELLVD